MNPTRNFLFASVSIFKNQACRRAGAQQGALFLLSEDGLEDLQLRDSVLVDSNVDQFIKPGEDTKAQRQSTRDSDQFVMSQMRIRGRPEVTRVGLDSGVVCVCVCVCVTSDLPGLSSDWSSRSGRFVAPITKTPTDECRASSSASS